MRTPLAARSEGAPREGGVPPRSSGQRSDLADGLEFFGGTEAR